MNKFFTAIKNLFFETEIKVEAAPKELEPKIKPVLAGVKGEAGKFPKSLGDVVATIKAETGHGKEVLQKDLSKVMTKLIADYSAARTQVIEVWGEDLVISLERAGHTDAVIAMAKGSIPDVELGHIVDAATDSGYKFPCIGGQVTNSNVPPVGSSGNPHPSPTTPEIAKSALAGVNSAKAAIAAITKSNGLPVDGYEYDEIRDADVGVLNTLLQAKTAEGWSATGPMHTVWVNYSNPAGGCMANAYSIRRERVSK
jgi:hypothetical protein